MKQMITNLNSYSNHKYQVAASETLGSDANNMQKYVFIYRTGTVNVTDTYQYKSKSFVRPPFVVQFQSNKTRVGEFVLVAVHTEASKAVKEMDQLYDVYQDISKKWNTESIMFLGNFNAGCGHMTRRTKKEIRLFTKTGFYWLIGDTADTTTSDLTECAYDRMVVRGKSFLKQVEPSTAQVFNFAKKFRVSMAEALDLSRNFPIEVELKSSAHLPQATPLLIVLSLWAILSSRLSAL
ncbi:hypothetical protein NHX12_012456 [Muraenolepis orangiensis]|uniref:Uncharacterized protein n=1 Tax=Muraenolepis orangiensis TaxID=630683 RepID=A0A9Q0DFH1_9TELE|nr:hypothetical protein NHX12_012456 [Muraenolepis orangiensis]